MSDDWKSEYPFASHYTLVGPHKLHYLDEGPAEIADSSRAGESSRSGETLLCVHGNPTWSFYWRHFVTAFRKRHRIVVPDHIGCGLSDKPQDFPYRLADHIADLRLLIERLDLRNITLLAHDWGGAIGMGSAVADPSRFSRIVLFNTAAFRSTRIPLRIRVCRTPVLGAWGVRGLNLFARAALSMATAKPERFTPRVRAGYLAPYDTYAHRVAIQRFVEDIPLKPSHPSYPTLKNIEDGLPKLAGIPKMFVWGMQDWCFTPHFLDRFLEFYPDGETHRFADAGHYVVEDAHERIVPLLDDFFVRHPLRG